MRFYAVVYCYLYDILNAYSGGGGKKKSSIF